MFLFFTFVVKSFSKLHKGMGKFKQNGTVCRKLKIIQKNKFCKRGKSCGERFCEVIVDNYKNNFRAVKKTPVLGIIRERTENKNIDILLNS